MKIGISSNTGLPCFSVIEKKGYQVKAAYFMVQHPTEKRYEYYEATKDNLFFSASSFEELLGTIHMWEIRGEQLKMTDLEESEYLDYMTNHVRFVEDDEPIYDEFIFEDDD